MDRASREARASAAFVSLADTLVSDFDLVELLHTLIDACVDLLDTDAGGLLLSDRGGVLQLMASSVEDMDVIDVVQVAAEAGPCRDCFTTGLQVSVPDIATDGGAWPGFQRTALQKGFRAVHATPMRLRGQIVGTLGLFDRTAGPMSARDVALAQSLTDVATIAILQRRGTDRLRDLSGQLQQALDGRIVIEQAKGLIASSLDVSMDDALRVLRTRARSSKRTLREVAAAVTGRRLVLSAADVHGTPHVQVPKGVRTDS